MNLNRSLKNVGIYWVCSGSGLNERSRVMLNFLNRKEFIAKEVQCVINCDEDTLKKFVLELKREGMFKDKRPNTFQKSEQLLYKYNDFTDAVKSKESQIEELKNHGLKKKSKSITKYGAGSGEVKTESEKLDEKIETIENTIDDTKCYIKIIDDALEKLKGDKFFKIIEMKYFQGMTHEDIGFEFDVDASTICRNKNRLIRKLAIQLFPDDTLNEILI